LTKVLVVIWSCRIKNQKREAGKTRERKKEERREYAERTLTTNP